MWIELPNELIEHIKDINDPFDRSIISINTLFDSMLKCQHIIYGSYELLKNFEKHELINPANKKFINWIRQRYVFIYECSEMIDYKIIVSINNNVIERTDNHFNIPLEYFHQTKETKLLTENESDAELFKNIFHQIYLSKKLSSNFTICFENDAFHGGNAPSKIKKAIEEERMIVCLVDSDKDYRGGESGSTYKGANEVYKKVKKNNVIHLKQLNVREKENLIPPSFYLTVLKEKNLFLEIMQTFIEYDQIISYFDIKDGIKFKKVQDEKWIKNYGNVIKICIDKGICIIPPENEVDKEKFLCMNGIGSKLCDTVSAILLECNDNCDENMKKHLISNSKKDEIYEFRKNILDNLPNYLSDEWNQIYRLLFSWGCCLSKNISPCYSFE